jgi:hypothetical protein
MILKKDILEEIDRLIDDDEETLYFFVDVADVSLLAKKNARDNYSKKQLIDYLKKRKGEKQ